MARLPGGWVGWERKCKHARSGYVCASQRLHLNTRNPFVNVAFFSKALSVAVSSGKCLSPCRAGSRFNFSFLLKLKYRLVPHFSLTPLSPST